MWLSFLIFVSSTVLIPIHPKWGFIYTYEYVYEFMYVIFCQVCSILCGGYWLPHFEHGLDIFSFCGLCIPSNLNKMDWFPNSSAVFERWNQSSWCITNYFVCSRSEQDLAPDQFMVMLCLKINQTISKK